MSKLQNITQIANPIFTKLNDFSDVTEVNLQAEIFKFSFVVSGSSIIPRYLLDEGYDRTRFNEGVMFHTNLLMSNNSLFTMADETKVHNFNSLLTLLDELCVNKVIRRYIFTVQSRFGVFQNLNGGTNTVILEVFVNAKLN